MPLYKQDGSDFWFVDFSIGRKRVRRSTGTTSKQAAQEYHDRLKADLWRQAKLGDSPDPTWDEAVARYLREKSDKRSIEHDKEMLRWSAPYLKGKRLSEITNDTLENLIDERRIGRSNRTKAGTTNATINRHLDAVMRVLNQAVLWGWLPAAPKKRKLKESRGRLRWLTADEIQRLLAEVQPHMGDMIRFTLATGLREQNVLGLEWNQIDMPRRVAWIHSDQAKMGRAISVPLNDSALTVLERRKGIHPTLVFTWAGKRIRLATSAAWYRALKRAKIDDFTWHGLRHTWASYHVMNGTPLAVLKELGGWTDMDSVMRYAHLCPGHVAQYSGNAPSVS
jgi:integrase